MTEKVDLSGFESGAQAPGDYHVDIVLDDRLVDTRDGKSPVFTPQLSNCSMDKQGINLSSPPGSFINTNLDNPGTEKVDLSGFESGAQAPGDYHVDIVLDDRLGFLIAQWINRGLICHHRQALSSTQT
jgi:outer membrane usher protein FimD/PapC